jgi:hypothetical protein
MCQSAADFASLLFDGNLLRREHTKALPANQKMIE